MFRGQSSCDCYSVVLLNPHRYFMKLIWSILVVGKLVIPLISRRHSNQRLQLAEHVENSGEVQDEIIVVSTLNFDL